MTRASERGRLKVGAAMGVTAIAGAIAILVAGCSGGTSSNNNAATTAAAATSRTAATSAAPKSAGARNGPADFQAYTTCLSQHGVQVPTFSARAFPSGSRRPRPSGSFVRPTGSFSRPPGGFGGAGGGFGGFLGSATADPATQAALKACASLLPQGGFGRGGPNGQGGQGGAISATTFAAFKSCMSDNGVTIAATDPQTGLRALNRADPKTAAALKVCQPIIAAAGSAGGSVSAAPSTSPSPSAG
ncbi:MAG: hypothetical protein ACRDV3_08015 [Acidothermaceae bacterium]